MGKLAKCLETAGLTKVEADRLLKLSDKYLSDDYMEMDSDLAAVRKVLGELESERSHIEKQGKAVTRGTKAEDLKAGIIDSGLNIVQSQTELPTEVQQAIGEGLVSSGIYKGKIYLVADNIKTVAEAIKQVEGLRSRAAQAVQKPAVPKAGSLQDVINNPQASQKEVIAEKAKLKAQVVQGVKSGEFDGAVRFGTVNEIKAILKTGRMPVSEEYGAIHAQPIIGKNDDTFAAYGAYDKHNMAIVFPKDSIVKKTDAHTKEVLINEKVDVRDLRFLIDGHEKIYTFDELEGAVSVKGDKNRTLYQKEKYENIDWGRVKELGKTSDIRESGYILPDGSMIDLSGKKEGGQPGTRSYDHREVGNGTAGMQEIIDYGYIRMDYNSGAIDIGKEPTPEQLNKIRAIASKHNGALVIDLQEGLGKYYDGYYGKPERAFYNQYPEGTRTEKIINDINRFYSGEMPVQKLFYQAEIPNIRHWIASKGGVNPNDKTWKGELKDIKTKKGFPKNFWNDKALGLDDLTATAVEEGWLPPGSTDQDLFDAIESNMGSPFTSESDPDMIAYNEWAWENYDGDEQAIRRDEEKVRADLNEKIRRAAETAAKRKAVKEVSEELGVAVELTPEDEQFLSTASETEYNNLFTPETTGKRGAIENLFSDNQAIIRAFEGADPSTPIHETGHLLTKILFKTRRDDYNILAEWAGVDVERSAKGLDAWTEEELEKVARGFERYIMEGKAPTMRLQPVFRKFKQWLIQVYKTIRALNVEISPEVKDVFDRLVSTEEERINDPVMGVLEWLKVDDVDASLKSEAGDISYDGITAKAKKIVLKRVLETRKKEKKDIVKQFKRAAAEIVSEMDIYSIIDSLVGQQGLDMFSIQAEYGPETVNALNDKKKGLVSENGINPEKFATGWGYENVKDMIDEIIATDSPKQAEKEIYNRLLSEYENVLNEDHVSIYGQVIDEEIAILEQMLGQKPDIKPKAVIRDTTGQTKTEDYRKLRDDLKRDEKTTRQAFKAGKLEEALKLKKKQKETVAKMRQSVKDSRERSKTIKRMKRYLKMKVKTLPIDYQEQIADILNRYFVLPAKYQKIKARESIENLFDRAEAEGENVDVPRMIYRNKLPNPPGKKQVKAYTTKTGKAISSHTANEPMSLEDIQIVAQLVDSIAQLGKTKGKLIAGDQKRDLEDVVNKLVDKIFTAHKPKPIESPWQVIDRERKKMQAVERMKSFFLEELDQPEFIMRALDGWEDLGPVWQEIIKPIKEAWDKELLLGSDITTKLKVAFDRAGADRKWANEKIEITLGPKGAEETGFRRKEELFMIALNSWNDGNREALKRGYGYTDEQLNYIWGLLNDKEKQLCNDVWDILDTLFPMLEDVHLKHTGARLIKVDGKYFPLAFDKTLSDTADKFSQEKELKDLFASEYHMTRPEYGHRKERVGGVMPPLLSLSVLQNHVQKTVHDITHQLAVRDVQKIISHPKLREAIKRTLGERTYRQLMPWLQHVARPTYESNNSSTESFWKHLRKTSTLVNMGFKLTTAADQWTAIMLAVPEVGTMRVLQGLKQFYRNPNKAMDWVNELSPQMRFRTKQFDRDLNQFGKSFDPKSVGWTEDVRDAAFWLIKLNDLAVTYPVWIGAYHKGVKKFAGNQDKAVEYADMTVRKTQSTAAPWVLSAFQRGGKTRSEAVKMVGMFYTFFAAFKNQMREVHRRYGAGDVNTVQLMAAYWWKVILPGSLGGALIPKLIAASLFGDDDEPEELIKKIPQTLVGYYFGGIPVLRDVVNGFMSDYGYSFTPIAEAFESSVRLVKGVASGEQYLTSRKIVKGVTKTAGYMFGIPSAQINITLEGMLDLMNDETDDPSSLLFYKEEKKKKYKR